MSGRNIGGDEGLEAVGRIVVNRNQADAAYVTVRQDLDGADRGDNRIRRITPDRLWPALYHDTKFKVRTRLMTIANSTK